MIEDPLFVLMATLNIAAGTITLPNFCKRIKYSYDQLKIAKYVFKQRKLGEKIHFGVPHCKPIWHPLNLIPSFFVLFWFYTPEEQKGIEQIKMALVAIHDNVEYDEEHPNIIKINHKDGWTSMSWL